MSFHIPCKSENFYGNIFEKVGFVSKKRYTKYSLYLRPYRRRSCVSALFPVGPGTSPVLPGFPQLYALNCLKNHLKLNKKLPLAHLCQLSFYSRRFKRSKHRALHSEVAMYFNFHTKKCLCSKRKIKLFSVFKHES